MASIGCPVCGQWNAIAYIDGAPVYYCRAHEHLFGHVGPARWNAMQQHLRSLPPLPTPHDADLPSPPLDSED